LTPDIRGLTNLLDGNAVSRANLALIRNDADHGAIVQLHGVRKSGAIALGSRGDRAAGGCTQDGIARCPATAPWGCHQPNSPTDQCAGGRIRLQLDLLDVAHGAESNGRSLADTLRFAATNRCQREEPDKVPKVPAHGHNSLLVCLSYI
jgi:hypothetical protein